MFDLRFKMLERGRKRAGSRCAPSTSKILNLKSHIRHAISLIEILISMFVLLFGLMGVAAIFPVGNHYVIEGEKFDLGTNLAHNAFEELKSRGMLRPEFWLYGSTELNADSVANSNEFIQPSTATDPGLFNVPMPNTGVNEPGPGHAFVLDPLAAANTDEIHFPFASHLLSSPNNPWFAAAVPLAGNVWPVRRLTLPQAGGVPFTSGVAEVIFRLRDDLIVTQPEENDRPSIQNWDLDGSNLLRRQYKGNYSWLATIVPTSGEALASLQTGDPSRISQSLYDVSVVVFRKRDTTPSEKSERLITAEILNDGEVAIYSTSGTADQDVDDAVDEIRPGNWIALTGVNQTTGDFMLKWYRLLSLDSETDDVVLSGSTERGRYAMLDGPNWPSHSYTNLRAVILPGAISVTTEQMKMEE